MYNVSRFHYIVTGIVLSGDPITQDSETVFLAMYMYVLVIMV